MIWSQKGVPKRGPRQKGPPKTHPKMIKIKKNVGLNSILSSPKWSPTNIPKSWKTLSYNGFLDQNVSKREFLTEYAPTNLLGKINRKYIGIRKYEWAKSAKKVQVCDKKLSHRVLYIPKYEGWGFRDTNAVPGPIFRILIKSTSFGAFMSSRAPQPQARFFKFFFTI